MGHLAGMQALPTLSRGAIFSKSHANWLPATNFSRFVRILSIRLNQVKSKTFLTHPILSRGAIFSKSHANWLPACWIDSRGKDLCRFDRIDNIFNPPSKPKSAIFSIHTTGSQDPWNNDTWTFLVPLKCGNKLQALYDSTRFAWSHISRKSNQTICVDLNKSSRIGNIFNLPCIVHESISG